MPMDKLIDRAKAEHARWRLNPGEHDARVKVYWAGEKPRANWCAAFASWCLRHVGIPVPSKGGPVRGARALTRWVAKHGLWVVAPKSKPHLADVLPGDLITWRRVSLGWECHVAIVTRNDTENRVLEIVEGNVGGAVGRYELSYEMALRRLRGLYGVARVIS